MINRLITRLESDVLLRTGRTRTIGFYVIALALASSLVALDIFPTDTPAFAWPPYIASIILFVIGTYLLFYNPQSDPAPPKISWTVVGILIGIIIIAAILRYYQLATLPFGTWYDEADISQAAQKVLLNPDYRPIFITGTSNDHALHFFAIAALVFNYLGVSTWSLRVVTAAFGVLGVIPAFFLGRELLGNRFGLILAFLVATNRWDITFSRFAILTITLPFFELLGLWLMLRAKRTGRVIDSMWAGLAIGLGLNFAIASRLFPLVVFVFLGWWGISLWRKRASLPSWKSIFIINTLALGATVMVTFAPVLQFALTQPENFWGRTAQVSIFTQRDEPNLAKAIFNTTTEHLLMFNYHGDNNGRHNIPGEPMLDPVTGALFVLGIALALSRPRYLPNILMLLLFVLSLSAGIFSLDFEAPQAERSLGVIVPVLYFIGFAVETLWQAFERNRFFSNRVVTTSALAILGGVVLSFNTYNYFVRWGNDDGVWTSYNGVESLAAYKMLAVDPVHTKIYASVFLNNHLVIQFLAPEVKDSTAIVPPLGLPLHEPGDRPVSIFIDENNTWIVDEARHYYPNAKFSTYTTPNGHPALEEVDIPADQIQSIQGLTANYWLGDSTNEAPAISRPEKSIAANWPEQAPLASPFVASWEGIVYAPNYGEYKFQLQSPANATLWLDEKQVLSGEGETIVKTTLAEGNHTFRLQANSGTGRIELMWQPPDLPLNPHPNLETLSSQWLYLTPTTENNGLLGTYYPNADWSEPLSFTRVDPFLDMYFHLIPLGRPYTVDWSGQVEAPTSGEYAFGLWLNGHAKVFIDNQLVIDAPDPTDYIEGKITLDAGRHKIQVKYLDDIGGSLLHLYWTLPGSTERQAIPSNALWPYPQP